MYSVNVKFRDFSIGSFLHRQIQHVSEGGFTSLFYKVRAARWLLRPVFFKLLVHLFLLPVTAPLVLLTRLLRPVVLVRFCVLNASSIIYVSCAEHYLCEREMGLRPNRAIDFVYFCRWMGLKYLGKKAIVNRPISKMVRRSLPTFWLTEYVHELNNCLPGGSVHSYPLTTKRLKEMDYRGLFASLPAHLHFTSKEEHQGDVALLQIGIPEGVPFVCFHARDAAYRTALGYVEDLYAARNSRIQDYLCAAEELTQRGYFAIRMGGVVQEALQSRNPRVLDYATRYRTEFLDVVLSARCSFFIVSACGLVALPRVFRRPCAMVNVISYRALVVQDTNPINNLVIPKKLWSKEQQRFLTFHEIFERREVPFSCAVFPKRAHHIADLYTVQDLERAGIEVVDNTPEEIRGLAIEMDERLRGTWQATDVDDELQQCFWSRHKDYFIEAFKLEVPIRVRIGADFLRRNEYLLE